jgi:hypothetical protein
MSGRRQTPAYAVTRMAPVPIHLMIVSHGRESLYEELRAMYQDSQRVCVIFDRRVGSDRRRGRMTWSEPERRRENRRQSRPDVEKHLALLGWAFIR